MFDWLKKKKPKPQPSAIGKVSNTRYPSLYEWVVCYDGEIFVGSCTVFHGVKGYRAARWLESILSASVTHAEMRQAAGEQFKVLDWKELMGDLSKNQARD